MSTALAIAGVSAVLRDLLNDGLINHNVSGVVGSTVLVTALPPDRVIPASGTEASQINLFLHQVTHNSGWKNRDLPSRDSTGAQRLSNPPLALDLHYLVSAYGSQDLHAEILLGYAMQLLHENAVLSRDAIRTALSPSPTVGSALPPALRALADCGLADQVEHIRISPAILNSEEMSRLWAAVQSHYRPTAAYSVSVVLIQPVLPALTPMPVLTRGQVDPVTNREAGVSVTPNLLPPLPTIDDVVLPGGQPAVRLGETVDLAGFHLNGASREVLLVNDRMQVDEVLPAVGANSETHLQFAIPIARAADFPAGIYHVTGRMIPPGEANPRLTNRVPLTLAPRITGLPMSVVRNGAGAAIFTLNFQPDLQRGQTASLILGQQEVEPQAFAAPVSSLNFVVPAAIPGSHLARLRIDGADSLIINRAAKPPVFLNERINIV